MSTILKALRRLEEDRNPLGTRPLREEVTGRDTTQARSRLAVFLVLGVGVVAGAGALAFLSVSEQPAQVAALTPAQQPPARAAAPPPQPVREEPRPAAAPAPRAVAPPPARGLPSQALASEVKVLKRSMPGPRLPDPDAEAGADAAASSHAEAVPATAPGVKTPSAVVAKASAPAPPPVAAKPPPAAERPAQPRPARSSAPQARAAPEKLVEKRAAKPAATPEPVPVPKPAAALEPAPPPAIAHALVPELRVAQTRWHPDAARRTALVEVDGGSREVQEGDALGPLVVTTIEPSGVVFVHQGVEVRRRIGE